MRQFEKTIETETELKSLFDQLLEKPVKSKKLTQKKGNNSKLQLQLKFMLEEALVETKTPEPQCGYCFKPISECPTRGEIY